jgi:predicted lipid-binding transport protein (Tim44 family)
VTTPVPRPEPVTVAGKIAGGLSGAVALLVGIGVLTTDQGSALTNAILAALAAVSVLVSVVAPIVTAYRARSQVTPLTDPRDNAGNQLVPAAATKGPGA